MASMSCSLGRRVEELLDGGQRGRWLEERRGHRPVLQDEQASPRRALEGQAAQRAEAELVAHLDERARQETRHGCDGLAVRVAQRAEESAGEVAADGALHLRQAHELLQICHVVSPREWSGESSRRSVWSGRVIWLLCS